MNLLHTLPSLASVIGSSDFLAHCVGYARSSLQALILMRKSPVGNSVPADLKALLAFSLSPSFRDVRDPRTLLVCPRSQRFAVIVASFLRACRCPGLHVLLKGDYGRQPPPASPLLVLTASHYSFLSGYRHPGAPLSQSP